MNIAMIDDMALPDCEAIQAVLGRVAYYIYAIGRRKPGASPLAEPIPGIDQRRPVREIVHGDLLALVSDVSLAEYDLSNLEERLQERDWLEMLAFGHQRVMAALLDGYTLLPLKICTLYTDEGRIRELLAGQEAQFVQALDRMEGAEEWGVKVFCDRAALEAWAEREAPQLRPLVGSLAGASAGTRYMLQKRLQRAAQQVTEELRHGDAQIVDRLLASRSRGGQRAPLQPAQIHGRGDEMVLNGAYLVADAELDTFAAALDELRAQYEPRGYSFVLTGPWPPYSFSAGAADHEVA